MTCQTCSYFKEISLNIPVYYGDCLVEPVSVRVTVDRPKCMYYLDKKLENEFLIEEAYDFRN